MITDRAASICNLKGSSNSCVLGGLAYYFNHGVTVTQSYAKCTISNALNAQGLDGNIITQSYSACAYENVTTVYGLSAVGSPTVTSSFYDKDIAPDAVDTVYGATTENLKSASWLREQGWAI